MRKRKLNRIIATLSTFSLVAGAAIFGFTMFQIHQSSSEQAKIYLPAAEKNWNKNSNTILSIKSEAVIGDFLGTIEIPSISKKMNIFQGTSTKELLKGVGHFIESVMPGTSDNAVLAGHRDTVFSNLGKVKIGAQILIKVESGSYIYEVSKIRIVDKNDRTVIVPTSKAVLTLSTCYPFVYFGNAPKRYIVIAKLVTSSKTTKSSIVPL